MYRVSIPTSLGPWPAHDMCVRSVIGLGASGDSMVCLVTVWCSTATSAHVSSMVEQSSLEDSIRF